MVHRRSAPSPESELKTKTIHQVRTKYLKANLETKKFVFRFFLPKNKNTPGVSNGLELVTPAAKGQQRRIYEK